MLKLNYTENFRKSFRNRISKNKKLNQKFLERINLFLQNPQNPVLKNHKLKGTKKYLNSFSITGDIRVLYYLDGGNVYLIDIGSHNQVY